jgi:hypothetical protein
VIGDFDAQRKGRNFEYRSSQFIVNLEPDLG